MLQELTIQNLAIIDKVHLNFTQGFNVLTGETGAGKSIVIDAVSLLLGGRGGADFVRAGSKSAYIEGIFRLEASLKAQILPRLEAEALDSDDEGILILSREIRANGRTFCRINGRSVNLTLLSEIAEPLIDIHGQNQHLSLLHVKAHLNFLDRYGNLLPQRKALASEFKKLQAVQKELHTLQSNAQQIARRMDQLQFQVEEIEAANLSPGEDDSLTAERTRLANSEKLNKLSSEAYSRLVDSADQQPTITDMMGQVVRNLMNLSQTDPDSATLVALAENINYEIENLSGELQTYAESIEFNPKRLNQVEERLGMIYNLKRKYGDSIEAILTFGERAAAELESISNAESRIEELQAETLALRKKVGQLAQALSTKRQAAGQTLARGVENQLKELGMARTQFAVQLERTPNPKGVIVGKDSFACDETGLDQVEFLIAPNPGEPLKPMVKIASGGETSRLMLALKTVLAQADDTPTLIFDEIDQGIGGRIGGVVGQKLWGLTKQGQRQVLCITHLPQIAAFGDQHYQVAKAISGQRTSTQIHKMLNAARVDELAQMLGTLSDTTRLSAQELLQQSETLKEQTL